MIKIEVIRGDVITAKADVLLLKHAQSFYGADESVFLRLSQADACSIDEVSPADGEAVLMPTQDVIDAKEVLFIGTPRLGQFSYREIRLFAQRAIAKLSQQRPEIESIAATVHGAGFGLDAVESLRCMLLGFQQGLTAHPLRKLKRVSFVERNPRRFEMLESAIADIELVIPSQSDVAKDAATPTGLLNGMNKKSVFVAMPFTDNFEDVYQFGIYQTVRRCGYVCEKVDESVYAGNIVERIMTGIQEAAFVIADLTEERPNVYLEVGYAWALNKPVILVAREGQRLHFDLSHHKCLFYKSITKLAECLEKTIQELFGHGGDST